MEFKEFEKLIEQIVEASDKDLSAARLGIDLINFVDTYHVISSILLTEYYGQEGAEWIEWYVYEKLENPSLTAKDADGNEICHNLESLWKTVEDCRKSKTFKGVEFQPEMTEEERIEMLKVIFGGGDA